MWWVHFSAHAPGPRLASLLMRDAFLKEEREPTEENAVTKGPDLGLRAKPLREVTPPGVQSGDGRE